jgi:hypothetical protein
VGCADIRDVGEHLKVIMNHGKVTKQRGRRRLVSVLTIPTRLGPDESLEAAESSGYDEALVCPKQSPRSVNVESGSVGPARESGLAEAAAHRLCTPRNASHAINTTPST